MQSDHISEKKGGKKKKGGWAGGEGGRKEKQITQGPSLHPCKQWTKGGGGESNPLGYGTQIFLPVLKVSRTPGRTVWGDPGGLKSTSSLYPISRAQGNAGPSINTHLRSCSFGPFRRSGRNGGWAEAPRGGCPAPRAHAERCDWVGRCAAPRPLPRPHQCKWGGGYRNHGPASASLIAARQTANTTAATSPRFYNQPFAKRNERAAKRKANTGTLAGGGEGEGELDVFRSGRVNPNMRVSTELG